MSVNWIVRRAIARWLRRSRWELDDTLIVCCHLVSPYSHSKRICLKPLMTPVTLAPSFSMTAMAARLSAPFPFVRVDLYDVHGHPYFGELTFTPAGGRLRLASDEIDRFLGRLLQASPGAVRASTDAVRSELASLAREAEAARPV